MNVTAPAPGSSGVRRASWTRNSREAAWSWRTWPWVNVRRNDPASMAHTPRRTVQPCRRGGPRPGRRSNRPRSACPPRSWRSCPTRWLPCPSGHAAAHGRCRAGRTIRPTASPVPTPRTTRGSDRQTLGGPRQHCVVASPARCPLEMFDQSVKNFDLPSSEGIIMSGAPRSSRIHPWIEAKAGVS